MKKTIILVLTSLVAILLTACKTTTVTTEPIEETSYESIYEQPATTPYGVIPAVAYHNAAFGYTMKTEQGYNHWFYQSGPSLVDMTQMTYSTALSQWIGSDNTGIHQQIMIAGSSNWTVRQFIAPATQNGVEVSGTIKMAETALTDVHYAVYQNNQLIYPTTTPGTLSGNELIGIYHETTVNVVAGDVFSFVISSASGNGQQVDWSPSVDYLETETNLHFDNGGSLVGDVHPFYDNGKLYLFYLNLGGRFETMLATSENMISYSNTTLYQDPINPPLLPTYFALCVFKDGDLYRSYYGANDYMGSSVSSDLIHWSNGIETDDDFNVMYQINHDFELFPKGGRDPQVFYDPDIDRFRSVGLYYRVWQPGVALDSSIGLHTSISEKGDIWDQSAVELHRFPTRSDGEPEVPQMMKIGDRWYLLASLSGLTTHNVGGPSYFIGEANTRIDDDNWMQKESQYLEGEDLIAAQFVQVGTKVYLFGWLPQVYNEGRWGGYLNVAREVFQLSDGTLGTRLDPYLTSLLNKGLQYNLSSGNAVTSNASVVGGVATTSGTNASITAPGTYHRSLVTVHVEMPENATTAGLRLTQGVNTFEIVIRRLTDGTYMQIGSPRQSHSVSSKIRIGDAQMTEFDLKIMIEAGIIEFFVNEERSLTGRIPLTEANYAISLIANQANVRFSDFNIYKLASQENLPY